MADNIVTAGGQSKKIGKTIVSGEGAVKVLGAASASGAAQGSGNEPSEVAARGYVSSKGYGGITDWDGENVVIGGTAVKPLYVKDGTAYVSRSDADSAIGSFEKRNGIKGNDNIMKSYEDKYGKAISDARDAVVNRESFSYSPDKDSSFLAARDRYLSDAEAAYRRVLNDNNTSLTGASGAVLSEAMASRDSYISALAELLPEYEKNAYSRYSDETKRLNDNLKAVTDEADAYYDRLYKADRDAVDAVNSASEAENDERQRLIENDRKDEQNRIENERNAINDAYKNSLNAQELQKNDIELGYYSDLLSEELRAARNENTQTEVENAVNNAVSRGFFTAADEAALPWLSAYRTASGGYSVTPWEAQAREEYDIEHAKKRAEIMAELGL